MYELRGRQLLKNNEEYTNEVIGIGGISNNGEIYSGTPFVDDMLYVVYVKFGRTREIRTSTILEVIG
jgi:hypothetical protein